MAQKQMAEFLKKGSVKSKVEKFETLSKNVKSKEELRTLEENVLTPDPIPLYVGEERRYIMNSEFAVKFVFKNQEEMDLFGEFVPIAEYREKSITNIKIILDLFKAIKEEKIAYNKKTGEFEWFGSHDAPEENERELHEAKSLEPEEEKTIEEPTARKRLFRKR